MFFFFIASFFFIWELYHHLSLILTVVLKYFLLLHTIFAKWHFSVLVSAFIVDDFPKVIASKRIYDYVWVMFIKYDLNSRVRVLNMAFGSMDGI
jgi:hypothetical protein